MLDPDQREAMAKAGAEDRRRAEIAHADLRARTVNELEAATIGLRDAVKGAQAAKARYEAALQAFNRCVAPDNG